MTEKARIGNVIFNLVSMDEYMKQPSNYGKFDAVKEGKIIYPIKNKTDIGVGIYSVGPMVFTDEPVSDEDKERYAYNDVNVINFSNAKSLREVIDKQDIINQSERSILTKRDNIFVAPIGPNTTPHMAALKQAINDKEIDMDKYKPRFGNNFENDIRLLNKDDITMNKLRSFIEKLDLKATIIIEDANPDVPNPIGHKIIGNLNSSTVEEA